jgi:A/G-specific adenine glycosylase
MDFATKLLEWSATSERNMPWKGEKDPYRIWLSEIILQQTKVEQGLAYYIKFIEKYPNIISLANAELDSVLKLWQGLGYYSRARNLHTTAQIIATEYNGIFPLKYEEILKLKGIGTYTAAAISSFAYDACIPVIDGNVIRVLARVFGIQSPIDQKQGLDSIKSEAQKNISKTNPALYNQAIMDFGAILCKPRNPDCNNCPFSNECVAYNKDLIASIPLKSKKIMVKKRYFNYIVLQTNKGVPIEKRLNNDIWKELYQFPMIETDSFEVDINFKNEGSLSLDFDFDNGVISEVYFQKLTHQEIYGKFYIYQSNITKEQNEQKYVYLNAVSKNKFAFPKIITTFIEKHLLILN